VGSPAKGARATAAVVRTLNAARLAADVLGLPSVVVATYRRPVGGLATSDVDEYDRDFVTGRANCRGLLPRRDGHRGRDLPLAARTPTDLVRERRLPISTRRGNSRMPCCALSRQKLLAYNCSPSFQLAQASRRRADSKLRDPASGGTGFPVHSPSPASTRSTHRCSSSPVAMSARAYAYVRAPGQRASSRD